MAVAVRTERIFDAAAELFVRYGVAKTTVDEIARAAGISKGAVYLEFRSKDALIEALVRQEMRVYVAAVLARVEADPDGGRLSRIYQHSARELLARPFLRALYTRDADVLGAYVRRGVPRQEATRSLLNNAFVQRLREANLIRPDIDAEVLSQVMGVVSLGLVTAGPSLGGTALAGVLDLVARMLATTVEPPAGQGDVEAGRKAFAELCAGIDAELAR
ncbi:TetR/AcrR family transcriptional regulator [Actinopolymorpha alba]|uniref:TetR/AcrR family transcriptional regulator n=1 Tax=Actinopolymorpha alba TaxID=533267 RepID=UPI000364F346|nr:TetR/AcrR family transcriptional regulator [Actinopolymorpha alba]